MTDTALLVGASVFAASGCATQSPPATAASAQGTTGPAASGSAAKSGATPPPQAAPAGPDSLLVTLTNPLAVARPRETIALSALELGKVSPGFDLKKTLVVDAAGNVVLSQVTDLNGDADPEELLFQTDLGPSETKTFRLRLGARGLAKRAEYKVYGRFVRERHDDFAWENDLVAHRVYGPDLETTPTEPLVSSGIDTWVKRTHGLVVNDWYLTDAYHEDHGEGADFYSVGKTRGCGGLGVFAGGKLEVSKNFVTSRVLANGPIRLVFELDYAPWLVAGAPIAETRRVTLDAGSPFNRFDSTFKRKPGPWTIGLGIAKHAGAARQFDESIGSIQSFEPLNGGKEGNLGCAIVVGPGQKATQQETETDHLLLAALPTDGRLVYYVGSVWDRVAPVPDAAAWGKEAREFSARVASPVKVAVQALPAAATWSKRAAELQLSLAPGPAATDPTHLPLVLFRALEQLSAKTNDPRYADYVKQTVDRLTAGGSIQGYSAEAQDLEVFGLGRLLLALQAKAAAPDKERYGKALEVLRAQLKAQPRTKEGAYWHAKANPEQLWLDDAFSLAPFLAESATASGDAKGFGDAVQQLQLLERHLRNQKSGLLVQGFDATKKEKWANPNSGTSATFWGVATGKYALALVDVLERLPPKHPGRGYVVAALGRVARAIAATQDPATGVWWQVLDAPKRGKNYLEASASALFVHALAKGVRNGWLPAKDYDPVVRRGYRGMLDKFVSVNESGAIKLDKISRDPGLSRDRDSSNDSYMALEAVANDPDGLGAFILASLEIESHP